MKPNKNMEATESVEELSRNSPVTITYPVTKAPTFHETIPFLNHYCELITLVYLKYMLSP